MISFERASELLSYNPETGDLRWNVSGHKRLKGKVAGHQRKGKGYVIVGADLHHYYAHRIAWLLATGEWPSEFIDHIDGDPTNNRFSNLRAVSSAGNAQNMSLSSRNKSGILGVHFNTHVGRWTAQIRLGAKAVHLGFFDTKEEAAEARKLASERYGFHQNHGRQKAHADSEGFAA